MPRGGKREGAGRKVQGITRKVSLTLTQEEWSRIEESGETMAAFLRQFMHQPQTATVVSNRDLVTYERRHAEERWQIYLNNTEQHHDSVAMEQARKYLLRSLFPNNSEEAQVQTKAQYECPYTGKRFGSMDKLVNNAIPHLISKMEAEIQLKREKVKQTSPLYFDQIR